MSSFNNHRLNKNEPIGSFITDSFVAVGGFGQRVTHLDYYTTFL